jgi:hypothetical protein
VLLKNTTHNIALDTCAAAMNDSNFLEPDLLALLEVLFDNARDVLGMKGVEIYGIFYGKNDGFGKR